MPSYTDKNNKNKYDSQKKYNEKNIKKYGVSCHIINDYDIIEYIENYSNKSEFIKKAIRFYIANNNDNQ